MYHVDLFASSISDLQLPLVGLASKCWEVSIKCVVAGMRISFSFMSKGKRRQEIGEELGKHWQGCCRRSVLVKGQLCCG